MDRILRTMGLLLMLAAAVPIGCTADDDDDDSAGESFDASVEYRGDITILRVGGTPYEMGYQHGELLHDKIIEGGEWVETSEFAVAELFAVNNGYIDEAEANSHPDILAECQGMVDAVDDPVWTMDRCLMLAYGDVIIEALGSLMACSQFVAAGDATADGTMIHGRSLDWSDLRFLIENPTLIVRHPDDGIANVSFGFPTNVSPYSGMNAAGISLASNENDDAIDELPREGGSYNQTAYRILAHATSLDEAQEMYEAQGRIGAELMVVTDGNAGRAAVFELASGGMSMTELDSNGLALATNHFTNAATDPLDTAKDPLASTLSRRARLEQLLDPGGDQSLFGTVNLENSAAILRDTYNPLTDVTHPPDLFDDGGTIANNAAMMSMIFLPAEGVIYIADGDIPVPQNPFTGFTLDELVVGGGGAGAEPASLQ